MWRQDVDSFVGNTYSIENVSETSQALLYFSQSRKIKEGDDDSRSRMSTVAATEPGDEEMEED